MGKINKPILYSGIGLILVAIIVVSLYVYNRPEYVATVNGEKISENELHEALVTQYGTTTLDKLVNNKIVDLEIKKEGIEVSQDEIDAEMKDYKDYYGGEDAFQELLESSGVDVATIEKDIETYLATEKLLKDRITITDEEMEAYFNENKAQFAQEEEVKASHILVEDEKTANEVKEKIDAGEDFTELATEYSTDEATSENGGDLGYFGKGVMEQAFEDEAFAMKEGAISDPVETSHGYHIIKLEEKVEAEEADYDKVKEDIQSLLFDQKVEEEYPVWLNEKMSEYEIEYTLDA